MDNPVIFITVEPFKHQMHLTHCIISEIWLQILMYFLELQYEYQYNNVYLYSFPFKDGHLDDPAPQVYEMIK